MLRLSKSIWIATTLCALAAVLAPALAGKHEPFTARAGMDLARDAALIWAADAQLIYVENDEQVGVTGTSTRWGYLFYSERKQVARGYSIRDGKILEASDLEFDFEAPPLAEDWVDSSTALAAAEKKGGEKYRTEHGGKLETMLLIRGAFHDKKPDATTWAFLYTSQGEPALVIVVDAAKGDVVRTWRG